MPTLCGINFRSTKKPSIPPELCVETGLRSRGDRDSLGGGRHDNSYMMDLIKMLWTWKKHLNLPRKRHNVLPFYISSSTLWISSGHLMHDAAGNLFLWPPPFHCVISFHKTLEMWKDEKMRSMTRQRWQFFHQKAELERLGGNEVFDLGEQQNWAARDE